MQAVPAPSAAEARENAAFEGLLWALSRPGRIWTLPEPGEGPLIAALLDRECRVHAADPLLLPEIMRTGAEISEIARADHVFLGALTSCEVIPQIAIGSDLYPDAGATVILRAKLGEGPTLRLTGPGVDGAETLRVGSLPEGVWAARAAHMRYPMGFEIFLIDGAQVLGIPRSTTIEVL